MSASLLAACSTSDLLTVSPTPPAAVGAAPSPSAVQTPPPIAAAPQTGVARQNLAAPPASAPGYSANNAAYAQPAATQYDTTPGRGRPASTFGQQAAQLGGTQQSGTPVSANQQPAPPRAEVPQQVAANAASIANTQQQPLATPAAQASPAAPTATATAANQTTAASSSIVNAQTLRFLPIIGAPSEKLQPLSTRLGDSVRAAGLKIVPMDQTAADLSLKGYFSVVDQDGRVSVIYVWDVIGTDGIRLHRIQGSKASSTTVFSGTDPWDGVTSDMMAEIGQDTIGALLAWLDSQG